MICQRYTSLPREPLIGQDSVPRSSTGGPFLSGHTDKRRRNRELFQESKWSEAGGSVCCTGSFHPPGSSIPSVGRKTEGMPLTGSCFWGWVPGVMCGEPLVGGWNQHASHPLCTRASDRCRSVRAVSPDEPVQKGNGPVHGQILQQACVWPPDPFLFPVGTLVPHADDMVERPYPSCRVPSHQAP